MNCPQCDEPGVMTHNLRTKLGNVYTRRCSSCGKTYSSCRLSGEIYERPGSAIALHMKARNLSRRYETLSKKLSDSMGIV